MRLLIIVLAFSLAACQSFNRADELIMSGEAEQTVALVQYTDIENEIIQAAIDEYEKFHDKWKLFIKNPVRLSTLGNEELENDYEELRLKYFELENVVIANFNRYDKKTQKQLLRYQMMAVDVDVEMETIKTIDDVATYGAIIASIAAKILVLP